MHLTLKVFFSIGRNFPYYYYHTRKLSIKINILRQVAVGCK